MASTVRISGSRSPVHALHRKLTPSRSDPDFLYALVIHRASISGRDPLVHRIRVIVDQAVQVEQSNYTKIKYGLCRCNMANEKILEEMKLEYDRCIKRSGDLTKKSSILMSISGLLITLMIGFYQLQTDSLLSIFSASMMIVTVIFCVYSNLKDFLPYVLGKKIVTNGRTDFEKVNKWINLEQKKYYHDMIGEYAQRIDSAKRSNDLKLILFAIANVTFVSGLIMFAVPVLISVDSVPIPIA